MRSFNHLPVHTAQLANYLVTTVARLLLLADDALDSDWFSYFIHMFEFKVGHNLEELLLIVLHEAPRSYRVCKCCYGINSEDIRINTCVTIYKSLLFHTASAGIRDGSALCI